MLIYRKLNRLAVSYAVTLHTINDEPGVPVSKQSKTGSGIAGLGHAIICNPSLVELFLSPYSLMIITSVAFHGLERMAP